MRDKVSYASETRFCDIMVKCLWILQRLPFDKYRAASQITKSKSNDMKHICSIVVNFSWCHHAKHAYYVTMQNMSDLLSKIWLLDKILAIEYSKISLPNNLI